MTQSFLFKQENEELPTDTSSSRFGPTITVVELAKQRFARIPNKNPSSSCGVVVKLLACGARGLGFDSRSSRYDSRVVVSCFQVAIDMDKRSLKRHKSSTQPTTEKNRQNNIFALNVWRFWVDNRNATPNLIIRSFFRSCIHSFIHSFIYSFIHSLTLSFYNEAFNLYSMVRAD